MKKVITLAALGALIIPFSSYAATYHYIALDGSVRDVEAPNAEQALVMANAQDAASHSGVKLDTGLLDTGDKVEHTYEYVSVTGSIKSVSAASLNAAYILANDRASNSGFMLLN